MLQKLKGLVKKIDQMPDRAYRMEWLEQFRTSKIYDNLNHAFMDEKGGVGGREYIKLSDRRPAVRFGLPQIIVQDTTSLVFGEDHFPMLQCNVKDEDPKVRTKGEALDAHMTSLIAESGLREVMQDAAMRGSKGSIAVWFKVLSNRVFWEVKETKFLTPTYDPNEPDRMTLMREQYRITKDALVAQGYVIPDTASATTEYWWRRDWNVTHEVWYAPWPCKKENSASSTYDDPPVIDTVRSVEHALGFVPMVWIKNLPGGDGIDGASTFEAALDNSIEIDYQLSQAGRGLKYSSDPTLHIKDPAYADGVVGGAASMPRGAANAIVSGADGDAKLLEISGSAAAAVVDYARFLREISMELCGGNRSSPEKMGMAQSGRAMEMMNQGLIWLAGKLRTSYGSAGLVSLYRMVLKAAETRALIIDGETFAIGKLPKAADVKFVLKWPEWYQPTAADLQAKATGIGMYIDKGVISPETATAQIATEFDIEDVSEEHKKIDAAKAKDAANQIAIAAAGKPLAGPGLKAAA